MVLALSELLPKCKEAAGTPLCIPCSSDTQCLLVYLLIRKVWCVVTKLKCLIKIGGFSP